MKVKRRKVIQEDPEVDKDKVLMTLMYLSGGNVSSIMLMLLKVMYILWILNVKFYNSSLSLFHHYFGFFFLYRETNPEKKLEKRMVMVSPSFSTPPRRISIVPESRGTTIF